MKLPLKQLLLVLGLAATAYAALLLWTGRENHTPWLPHLYAGSGLLAAALCVLNYVLRGLRWRQWMAHYQRHLPLGAGLRLYLAGYTFTPTPGNVGEAARGLLLLQQPLSPGQSLSIFGAERLADLLSLLLLTLPAVVWLLGTPQLAPWLGLVLQLAIGGALLLGLLAWRWGTHFLQRFAWLAQAWDCLRIRPTRWLGLSVLAWAAQGVAVWLICRDFGLELSLWLACGFYALAMVGGALSLLPAGLGGMEALLTGLLLSQNSDLGQAAAITVLVRVLTLWLAVGIGAVALLYSAAYTRDISLS